MKELKPTNQLRLILTVTEEKPIPSILDIVNSNPIWQRMYSNDEGEWEWRGDDKIERDSLNELSDCYSKVRLTDIIKNYWHRIFKRIEKKSLKPTVSEVALKYQELMKNVPEALYPTKTFRALIMAGALELGSNRKLNQLRKYIVNLHLRDPDCYGKLKGLNFYKFLQKINRAQQKVGHKLIPSHRQESGFYIYITIMEMRNKKPYFGGKNCNSVYFGL